MSAWIEIIDRQTDERRMFFDPAFDPANGDHEWSWESGPKSCDAHRAVCFALAGNDPPPENPRMGHVRFFVPYIYVSNGARLDVHDPGRAP